jgi:hypothetical protein
VSFATINLCVASQRVFIVAVYFVIDSVRKLLDTPTYISLGLRMNLTASWKLVQITKLLKLLVVNRE